MTELANTAISLPPLEVSAEGAAMAELPAAGEAVLSALMIRALRANADSVAGDKTAKTVSISLDMTGMAFPGGEARINSQIDRQTRTIIFMSGTLSSGSDTILKATAIFRLA